MDPQCKKLIRIQVMNISLRFTDKIRFTEEKYCNNFSSFFAIFFKLKLVKPSEIRKYFNISNLNFESKRFVCIFLLDPKIFAGSDPDPGFENVVDRKPYLVVLFIQIMIYTRHTLSELHPL